MIHSALRTIVVLNLTILARGFSLRSFRTATTTTTTLVSSDSSQRSTRLHWSKQASYDLETKQLQMLPSTAVVKDETTTTSTIVDLSSPRLWLESQPQGVYTVMRGDLFVQTSEDPWRLWGITFHINRLRESYLALYNANDSALRAALEETVTVAGSLLAETFSEVRFSIDLFEPRSTCVVMLTLLWYPKEGNRIGVKGHIFTSGKAVNPWSSVQSPINVKLAMMESPQDFALLPARKGNHPESKQSSWCTLRRPLEEMFKEHGDDDIQEVLLTDQQDLILEGLTSNFFALGKDSVLRTPNKDILQGYARERVISAAKSLGYTVEQGPVSIHDAYKWKEVFLTSSVSICRPVDTIFFPNSTKGERKLCWKSRADEKRKPEWINIYEQILKEERL